MDNEMLEFTGIVKAVSLFAKGLSTIFKQERK